MQSKFNLSVVNLTYMNYLRSFMVLVCVESIFVSKILVEQNSAYKTAFLLESLVISMERKLKLAVAVPARVIV